MKEHRELRELLGSYALGHLPATRVSAVRAHLDGCAACRAELADIAPLADDLAGVDADRVTSLVTPPADLGERIRSAVAAERQLVEARQARVRRDWRRPLLAGAASLVLLAAGTGLGLALSSEPTAPAVPVEQLALTADGPTVRSAGLVAHTWGVEVKLVASGFVQGEVYRAAVRTASGELVPAGEFLGTGDEPLTCNLQAALLRPDATGFVVRDAAGQTVLQTDL